MATNVIVVLGHLDLIYDANNGLDYMNWLFDEYGDVAKVKALGVCQNFILA
jgi:hypothetical protein